MNPLHRYLALFLVLSVGFLQADQPRWGFLGDDEQLEAHFDRVKHVAFVCVTEVELRDVKPPFADVIYHATVIECTKGKLEVGEKIQIIFGTDSLPTDDEERQSFIANANHKNKGGLKFAFLEGGENNLYHCEFMDVPTYTREMQQFLKELQNRQPEAQARQGGDE